MRADGLVEASLIKLGVIDACSAMGIDDLSFEEFSDYDDEGNEVVSYTIAPSLTLFQQRLAGYFCYILYLEKLKLSLNQDAINFSTLTFSIKGLEKRPEAINDQIYMTRRYLSDQINRINGGSAILGTAKVFGGDTNG
jgi:hypothetical protein